MLVNIFAGINRCDWVAKGVVQADFEEAGDEDVIRKLLGDLTSAGVDIDDGKIRAALKAGRAIPEGWAADQDGRPTTDPATALAGFLLPFGGHKGSGLSMAVDLLSGVLSGARFLTDVVTWVDNATQPQGTGHFFLLIDPARLTGREAYAAAMARFRELVKQTPAADPSAPVLLPGERELARRARSLAQGVELPSALIAELRAELRAARR